MPTLTLEYTPQERQAVFHRSKARQILYGGAAGGGKSRALRWDAITFCLQNPGCQAYLFRRTLPELEDNHIGPIQRELPHNPALGEYSASRKAYEFSNGSALHFRYCERESDVTRYQGAEMHWIGIDEASHLTDFQINYLKTRNRLGGWVPKQKGYLPRFAMASNPGGPGHSYLKSIFIDRAPPETLFYDDTMRDPANPEDPGWSSIFIPAKMQDNRFLDTNYGAQFSGLPPEYARALREGDWDAVVGQALHTLSRERHQLRAFQPPKHCTKFMAMDWGTARPFSVGWYMVSDGAELKAKEGWPARWLPAGAVIRYAEYYGWTGKPNQGSRLDASAVVREILKREKERDEVMDYRIGDSQMWAQHDGISVAERMMSATDDYFTMRKSKKDRKQNFAEVLGRLAGNSSFREDGVQEDHPMFFVTNNCLQFWRTVPILTLDEVDPDKGPNDKLENHIYDELAYALRSRPFITTQKDRWWEEWGEEVKKARGDSVDPYATA